MCLDFGFCGCFGVVEIWGFWGVLLLFVLCLRLSGVLWGNFAVACVVFWVCWVLGWVAGFRGVLGLMWN